LDVLAGSKDTTAQVHPEQFTRHLVSEAQALGVRLVYGTATGLTRTSSGAYTLALDPLDEGAVPAPSAPNSNTPVAVRASAPCPASLDNVNQVVVAAGPWTGTLLATLGLARKAGRAADIEGSRAHSVVLRTAEGRDLPAQALFTSIKEKSGHAEPEIYSASSPLFRASIGELARSCASRAAAPSSLERLELIEHDPDAIPTFHCADRPDGTAYACGPTDSSPLPSHASSVSVDKGAIARLVAQTAQLSPSHLSKEAGVTFEREQACYLPVGSGDPVLGRIEGEGDKGVFVAAGHSCWGICNGASSLSLSLSSPRTSPCSRIVSCPSTD